MKTDKFSVDVRSNLAKHYHITMAKLKTMLNNPECIDHENVKEITCLGLSNVVDVDDEIYEIYEVDEVDEIYEVCDSF